MRAYELAQRHVGSTEDFTRHLRYVLARELSRTRSTDALDAGNVGFEEISEQATAVPADVDAPSDERSLIEQRISERLSGRYAAIARMVYIEGRTIGRISKKTGLSHHWLKRYLEHIARVLSKG